MSGFTFICLALAAFNIVTGAVCYFSTYRDRFVYGSMFFSGLFLFLATLFGGSK